MMDSPRKPFPIEEHAVYPIDAIELACGMEGLDPRNVFARLRRRGFIRARDEVYYHPAHWKLLSTFEMTENCGDFYIDAAAFDALTPKAREWVKAY